ncbi:MAG TPA: helix-turn-helix domain-containing protein [Pseudonocardiaceae bacterium]|jgi:AcrR family transcriptional regulator|nr:helix-turn-helix domain-containing protein [Pseudonocardiaceae bacterium]
MTARRTYHHGDLRAALITAALTLIAEKGIAALSVAEAARRTGVSTAAPYRHFPSRQALLAAAAIAAAEELGTEMRSALEAVDRAEPDWAVAALGATAGVYVRFVSRRRAGFDLIFNPELQGFGDAELLTAGRVVIDLLLPLGNALTGGDMPAALQLLERHLAAAHGYATLFLSGFFTRRTTEVEDIAAEAVAASRALAEAALGSR